MVRSMDSTVTMTLAGQLVLVHLDQPSESETIERLRLVLLTMPRLTGAVAVWRHPLSGKLHWCKLEDQHCSEGSNHMDLRAPQA